MTNTQIADRIVQAANTLNRLTVNGVENAKLIALIYDHLNESARILRDETEGEE